MSSELIINASLPETRIALMEDGEIQELLVERASGKGIVGNIYKGRVTRVLPGMQAAFVDIGLEKAAFLYVDDVFVHSNVVEEQEAAVAEGTEPGDAGAGEDLAPTEGGEARAAAPMEAGAGEPSPQAVGEPAAVPGEGDADSFEEAIDEIEPFENDLDDEDDDDDQGPASMGPPPGEGDEGSGGSGGEPPAGTIAPSGPSADSSEGGGSGGEGQEAGAGGEGPGGQEAGDRGRRRHRRGRRGGRNRRRGTEGAAAPREGQSPQAAPVQAGAPEEVSAESTQYPDHYYQHVEGAEGQLETADRSSMLEEAQGGIAADRMAPAVVGQPQPAGTPVENRSQRPEFKETRNKDRRIRPKTQARPPRGQAKIEELLKEGQEVLVQVAKDPIATKGARLTCHISLPGRHLVCMPTIDHVGVSRRIERDEERRRLRDVVEKNRPKNLGFIVRTASGKNKEAAEKRIRQDLDYLARLWTEIREKSATVTAPALVYEDLNSVLRAIRDWVNEEIDKIVVDSRYHFNEIQRFVSHFMPQIRHKVELYHGDVPIFDAYNISTELARALERKVWLKSGGYLVVDQAEALVAIDVNTGRYVGKKNLEDTILKTNLEAVQEIAYQLRLRNCGGIIILDLIDMEKEENKQRVYRALEEALKKDRARPTILKISELGLVEMTRKRTRDTIIRTLCESCTNCEGKGFIKSKQTIAYDAMREIERIGIERDVNKILVQAHPDVIDILAIDERDSIDQLERRYRKQIYLQAVTDFHPEQFEVSGDGTKKATAGRSRDRDRDREQGRDAKGGRDRERDRGRRGGRDRDKDRDKDRGDRDRGGQQQRGPSPALPQPLSLDPNGAASAQQPQQGGSGLPEDDDRLAFLRAQAAQDAALAGGQAGGNAAGSAGGNPRFQPGPRGQGGQGQGGDRDRGGRRRRRGRRGGGGGRANGPRGPGAGAQAQGPSGGGGSEPAPSGGGGGEGGDGGRSNPPT